MAMNELFYRDPYAKEFESKVLTCEPVKDRFEVTLEDTAFYPEGGGQPADLGTLGGIQVLDVKRRAGKVVHYTDKALAIGDTVKGVLDWRRRFDHMQNHTGEHVFSGLVHAKFGYENVGFHMDESIVRCDFNGPMTDEEVLEMERATNEAILQDIPVGISFPDAKTLAAMDYRSKIELTGDVRIVDVPGCDRCACCGTHVRRTGEIGFLKILSWTRHRGGIRIEFVCGFRAIANFAKKIEDAQRITELLSAKPEAIVAGVEKALSDLSTRDERIHELTRELLAMRAESLRPENGSIVALVPGLAQRDLREFVPMLLTKEGTDFVAVFSPSATDAGLLNYAMSSQKIDLRALSKAFNQANNGKGGGNATAVQGFCRAETTDAMSGVWKLISAERAKA